MCSSCFRNCLHHLWGHRFLSLWHGNPIKIFGCTLCTPNSDFPECFLSMINYPVQIQFVPALCSKFCSLCCPTVTFCHSTMAMQTTLKAWTIKFNFVTGIEHISDKCLSSKWRLLDDLRVGNGTLKIIPHLPGSEKWEKHSKQRDHGYIWGKPHLFMWHTACHLIKYTGGSSNLIHKMELTYRTPWIHMLY